MNSINSQTVRDSFVGVVKEHSLFFPPALKTFVQVAMAFALQPAQSLVINHIVKKLSLKDAFQIVKMSPFAGAGLSMSTTLGYNGVIFFTKEIAERKLLENTPLGKEHAAHAGYIIGATTSTVVNNPLDVVKHQVVTKEHKKKKTLVEFVKDHKFSDLYRGVTPSVMRGVLTWGVGLAIGDKIYKGYENYVGDNTIGYLGCKSVGWVIGNFISSPLYNLEVHLKSDFSMNSMRCVLRNLGILYVPAKYKPSTYENLSSGMRLLLNMPDKTKMPYIESSDNTRLRAYHVIKNLPKLWRGFPKVVPLIVMSGTSIAGAERAAEMIVDEYAK